jgi:hypothetical protein
LSRKFQLNGVIQAALLLFFLTGFARCRAQDQQPQTEPLSTPPQNTQNPASQPPQEPQTPDQSSQNPPPKKDENANPAQTVGDLTKQVATTGFRKVRDWEVGLIAGTYVGRNRPLVPLTNQQRVDVYFQQTFTTPQAYWKRMFEAAIDQARDSPPQWGGGWGAYGKRFASREGQFIIANSLAALGNAKLGYEVRYEECRCSGFLPRFKHAFGRNFYTYNRTETEKRPQWALYGGAFGAGMISAAWLPNHAVLRDGVLGVAGQAAWGTLLNFFIEFAPDINRKLGAKKMPE